MRIDKINQILNGHKNENKRKERTMKITYKQYFIAAALVCTLAFATTVAQAKDIDTRIGKIETINGFPTAEAAQKIFDESDFQRATQCYLWALPAVGFQVAVPHCQHREHLCLGLAEPAGRPDGHGNTAERARGS
jgi:hypothetical protein